MLKLNVSKNSDGQYHWNVTSRNNRIVATAGGETYKQKAKLIKTLRLLFDENPALRIQIEAIAQTRF